MQKTTKSSELKRLTTIWYFIYIARHPHALILDLLLSDELPPNKNDIRQYYAYSKIHKYADPPYKAELAQAFTWVISKHYVTYGNPKFNKKTHPKYNLRLNEFQNTNWDIETKTAILCVNKTYVRFKVILCFL